MALGMGGKKPKAITAQMPAGARNPKPRGPKVRDKSFVSAAPDKTNSVSYPASSKKSMATRAASSSWATMLGFTKGK